MNIGGYELTSDFTTAGGGRCKWAFAKKGGVEYFLKCFLSPKQFIPGKSAGGRTTMMARQKSCAVFEKRQTRILAALDGKTGIGGNLIAPIDFFSYGGSYYKVTEKISNRGITLSQIRLLPEQKLLMILRSAAAALRVLHSGGLVHGDIKVDNIIIRERSDGVLTASVIDFDDSYFQGEPPMPPEEFTFDPPYASPEVFRFINEQNSRTGAALGATADIFSLGIVFCEYLTGEKPSSSKSRYLGEGLLAGGATTFPKFSGRPDVLEVVRSMLVPNPASRITLKNVLEGLAPTPSVSTAAVSPAASSRPRLVTNMRSPADAKLEGKVPPSSAATPTSSGASKLRGSLSRKSDT